jgi:hypothetical protein
MTIEIIYKIVFEYYEMKLKDCNIEDIENYYLLYLLTLNIIIEDMKMDDSFENMIRAYNIFLMELEKIKIKEENK